MRTEIVVNTLLNVASVKGVELTHLQIQKLLYFLHGTFLANTNRPLIDEPFQAWTYGPIIVSLYNQLNKYGSTPIKKYLPVIDKITGKEQYFVVDEKNKDFWIAFNDVWDRYAHKSGVALSALANAKKTPWDKADRLYDIIPNDVIASYFKTNDNKSATDEIISEDITKAKLAKPR